VDARDWNNRYAAAEQVWSVEPNQFVAHELAELAPGTGVDLACGEGRNAIWLARRGWTMTALDFSSVAVERGRSNAGDLPVTWQVGDALTADLPAVDLVVISYLQLPEAERRHVVRRGFAALNPGGRLLVVAHDSTNLTEGTGGPQDPTVLFTAEDILRDLDGEPFSVVRAERVPRRVAAEDTHGGEPDRTAWDALVHLIRSR
jgi:SAM-dependent methyltransferase